VGKRYTAKFKFQVVFELLRALTGIMLWPWLVRPDPSSCCHLLATTAAPGLLSYRPSGCKRRQSPTAPAPTGPPSGTARDLPRNSNTPPGMSWVTARGY